MDVKVRDVTRLSDKEVSDLISLMISKGYEYQGSIAEINGSRLVFVKT